MAVPLEKRTKDATTSLISMLKKQADKGIDLGEVVAQVILAIDFSGSMAARYRNNEVQTAVERALALSLSGLDDDGDIQVFFFDSQSYPMETVNEENYRGFVDAWTKNRPMRGTNYSKTIDEIVKFVGGGKKKLFGRSTDMASEPPVFVIFVTDGDPRDDSESLIMRKLVEASKLPIFWQFLGLGYSPAFLEELDTMSGRTVDNVGLTEMRDTLKMTDEQFFDAVIGEFFTSWLPKARRLGITKR